MVQQANFHWPFYNFQARAAGLGQFGLVEPSNQFSTDKINIFSTILYIF